MIWNFWMKTNAATFTCWLSFSTCWRRSEVGNSSVDRDSSPAHDNNVLVFSATEKWNENCPSRYWRNCKNLPQLPHHLLLLQSFAFWRTPSHARSGELVLLLTSVSWIRYDVFSDTTQCSHVKTLKRGCTQLLNWIKLEKCSRFGITSVTVHSITSGDQTDFSADYTPFDQWVRESYHAVKRPTNWDWMDDMVELYLSWARKNNNNLELRAQSAAFDQHREQPSNSAAFELKTDRIADRKCCKERLFSDHGDNGLIW